MAKAIKDLVAAAASYQLSTRHALIGAVVIAVSMYTAFAGQLFLSKDFITPAGPPVGGDYVAFWTAARIAVADQIAYIYDAAFFQEKLLELGPPRDAYTLTWQYPPTYFLAIWFLAFLPYGLGYVAWTGGSFALFALLIRNAGVRGHALIYILATPVVFHAIITGQNGFFAASLLLGATLYADKRPIVAGLCAAILTMKPQLGVLLPFAFIAAGCWRAFFVAAAGSIALFLASIAAFGLESWIVFIDGLTAASENVSSGVMPLFKMPTVFAAFSLAGAPKSMVIAMQIIGAATALCMTIFVWRTHKNNALRAGIVCVGAYFVSPYLFYYELVIISAPIALLALDAQKKGWRPFDHLFLLALFLAPLFAIGEPRKAGLNLGFFVTTIAFIYIVRQMRPAPDALANTPPKEALSAA